MRPTLFLALMILVTACGGVGGGDATTDTSDGGASLTKQAVCEDYMKPLDGDPQACVDNFDDLCAEIAPEASESECIKELDESNKDAAALKKDAEIEESAAPSEDEIEEPAASEDMHGTMEMKVGEPMQYWLPGDELDGTEAGDVEFTLNEIRYSEPNERASDVNVTLHLTAKNIGDTPVVPTASVTVWLGEDGTQQEPTTYFADGRCGENADEPLRPGRTTNVCWSFDVPDQKGEVLLFDEPINETSVALDP